MLTENHKNGNGAEYSPKYASDLLESLRLSLSQSQGTLDLAKSCVELCRQNQELVKELVASSASCHLGASKSTGNIRDWLMLEAERVVEQYGVINPGLEKRNEKELLSLIIQCELSQVKNRAC
ncbi:MAG TPA: hypothetical protein DCE56_25670 [Cyanobacteria bacterium UBA8553]|nr:hypothetical protein [Cyanobacteria bacterium UBA8553]